MRKLWGTICVSLMIMALLVVAGCGGGGSSPTTNTNNGTVAGVVTSNGTTPIVGATVSDSTGAYTTTTNSTGSFTLSLPAGNETLVFLASGYIGATANVSVSAGATSTCNKTLSVTGTGVITPTLLSIAVTPASPSIATGATKQFTATGTYSDASTKDLTALATWASSTSVAAISSSGLVTGVTAGVSTVTAKSGTISGSTTITVMTPTSTSTVKIPTTYAGSLTASGSIDGVGLAARFSRPTGITSDGTYLYIVDTANGVIRKVTISTGEVTTLKNAAGAVLSFGSIFGITIVGSNLFVADKAILKIDIPTGAVTELAGSRQAAPGSQDGIGSVARFYSPRAITSDGINLFVTDGSNYTVRKIVIATGAVTTIAGSPGLSGCVDGTGSAARFGLFTDGITTDGTNLFVSDTSNHSIRKIVIGTGVVTTLAGGSNVSGYSDGTGNGAQFSSPAGITTDGTYLYVADQNNDEVRKISISTGVVTTIASVGYNNGVYTPFEPWGITLVGTTIFATNDRFNTISKVE